MQDTSRKTALAAALAGALVLAGQSATAQEVTIASWGGSYQDAQSKALFQPVAAALGITAAEVTMMEAARAVTVTAEEGTARREATAAR